MQNKSVVSGVGTFLPSKVLTNADMEKMVDTSDAWIVQRTGIRQRHVVQGTEDCVYLATRAAERALKYARLSAQDIDAVIVATTSGDNVFPAVATVVARNLGISKGPAYDVAAACAGFIFALNSGDNLIRLSQATRVLIIGVDVFSKFMDWKDRNTCILFGDGAGAVVLSATTGGENYVLSTHIHSNGMFCDDLVAQAKPNSPDESVRGIAMKGKSVYKFAIKAMCESVQEALKKHGYTIEDISFLVPHQANIRIIDTVVATLGIPRQKAVVSLQTHANTSAATIPLALGSAVENTLFKTGDLIALTAMGAGFSWGSALLRWQ